MCRINYGCIKHLACAVNNGSLTACAISRIKCKHGFALYRRLHKQLLEVYGKNLHSIFSGGISKVVSDLTLN